MTSLQAVGSLQSVVDLIEGAKRIAVCGHTRPDGDSIGSNLALVAALGQLGHDAQSLLADNGPAPELYSFLPGFSAFKQPSEAEADHFDLFIAVDTPCIGRLKEAKIILEQSDKVAVVDHHPPMTPYGDAFYCRPSAAAAGEVVWELIEKLGAKRTPEIATCCYTALVTDTGRFQFQNTTAEVLKAAAQMVEAGAYPSEIASAVYQSRTYCSLALRARVMERLTITNDDKVAYSWLTQSDLDETGATLDDYEGMPDLVRTVRGIEVAVMLKAEADGAIRGNLRSKGDFDVGAVATTLGGGGHKAAAGFTSEDSSLEKVLDTLLPMLPGYHV